jgi:hypothetical protein
MPAGANAPGERMNRTDFISLSTQVARDLKRWVDAANSDHGLSADQLVTLQAAATVIDVTAVRVAGSADGGAAAPPAG